HRHAKQPKRRPEVVSAKFQRSKVIRSVATGQNHSPNPRPPGKKSCPDLVCAPCRNKIHRKENETHPNQRGCPFVDEKKNRSENKLKERHVIIKNVAVLDKSMCPSPDDVQMLRLVAVEPIVKDINDFDYT